MTKFSSEIKTGISNLYAGATELPINTGDTQYKAAVRNDPRHIFTKEDKITKYSHCLYMIFLLQNKKRQFRTNK